MVDEQNERNPIEVLAEDFLERRRQGESVSIEEYAGTHPELAGEIRDLFPTIIAMEQVKTRSLGSSDRPIELRVDKLEQLGDYRILGEIGRGGMGIVYEAVQQSLGRRVAVKVFPQQALGDTRYLQRFQREARVAAQLHHTNIVQVFGVGEQDGLSYYVMQLIRGVGLDEIVDGITNPDGASESTGGRFTAAHAARQLLCGNFDSEAGRADIPHTVGPAGGPEDEADPSSCPTSIGPCSSALTVGPEDTERERSTASEPEKGESASADRCDRPYWRNVARIGMQVAEALRYAHGQGTLHRDIKPGNLLLDPQGTVWVTDFGVAKALSQEQLSRTGDVVGTLRYMAPEQLEGACDARSDLYSLGLTLYELIALRPAYAEASQDRLVLSKIQEEPLPPRRFRPGIPRDLETIVLKAISRDPRQRYQSAGEMIGDLRRFLDDRPIRARRVGPVERFWRWSRRNPAVASLSAVLILVAINSFAAVSWKWHEAEAEKQRAQGENARAEANLSLALDSMGRFLDRFESTWMAHPRDPEDEEGDVDFHMAVSDRSAAILEDALVFYDQFAEQNAANPRLQRDTANAHRRVGEIHDRLGEYAKAEAAYRRAAEIYLGQLEAFPNDSELVPLTAATLNQLGGVAQMLSRFDDAKGHFERARQVLAEHSDGSSRIRYELAETHSNLGTVHWRLKSRREAARNHQASVALLEELVSEQPRNAKYRLALARAYGRFHFFADFEKGDRGPASYRGQSISILERLVEDFPSVPDYQCELSEALAMHGFRPRRSGDFESREAEQKRAAELKREAELKRAVQLARRVVDDYPEIPRYRSALARSLEGQASLAHRTGRLEDAEELFTEVVFLYDSLRSEFPTVSAYQFFLSKALHEHGDVLRELGRLDESRQALQAAIDRQRSYLTVKPDQEFCRSVLARQHRSLGETLKLLGDEEGAAEAFEQAEDRGRWRKDRHRR